MKSEFIQDLSKALSILPFHEQHTTEIHENSDLFKYFLALQILYPGSRNDSISDEDYFRNHCKETIDYWVEQYEKYPHSLVLNDLHDKELNLLINEESINVHLSNIKDFIKPKVIKAVKYLIAWRILKYIFIFHKDSDCLSKFIINLHDALIFEIEGEIECSLFLSSNFFYKQSLQVMRNFLELVILQEFFLLYPNRFRKWLKNQNFRTPLFRDMLNDLIVENRINHEEYNKLNKFYSELNNHIHSFKTKMNYRIIKDETVGLTFSKEYFEKSNSLFCKILNFCLKLQFAFLLRELKRT